MKYKKGDLFLLGQTGDRVPAFDRGTPAGLGLSPPQPLDPPK